MTPDKPEMPEEIWVVSGFERPVCGEWYNKPLEGCVKYTRSPCRESYKAGFRFANETRATPDLGDYFKIVKDALLMNEAMYEMFFLVKNDSVSAEDLSKFANKAMDLNAEALAKINSGGK